MTTETSTALVFQNETELKKFIMSFRFDGDPDLIFWDVNRKLTSDNEEGNLRLLESRDRELVLAAGIGSQYTVTETVHQQYIPLAVSFARQLIEEYGCKTPSEIAVAEVTAISHAHFIMASKYSRSWASVSPWHKEVERAQRRFLSALGALRALKRPSVTVNMVNAETAFMGPTQVNTTHNDNQTPHAK